MYNGIGLRTVRGSGTNGYVQRNLSFVNATRTRQTVSRTQRGGTFEDRSHYGGKSLPANPEILLHEQKRKIEVQLMEMTIEMESRGCGESEIEGKISKERERLLARLNERTGTSSLKNDAASSHARAQRKEEEIGRMKSAFGIASDHMPGESFDPEMQEKRRLERTVKRQREFEEREASRQLRLKEREERHLALTDRGSSSGRPSARDRRSRSRGRDQELGSTIEKTGGREDQPRPSRRYSSRSVSPRRHRSDRKRHGGRSSSRSGSDSSRSPRGRSRRRRSASSSKDRIRDHRTRHSRSRSKSQRRSKDSGKPLTDTQTASQPRVLDLSGPSRPAVVLTSNATSPDKFKRGDEKIEPKERDSGFRDRSRRNSPSQSLSPRRSRRRSSSVASSPGGIYRILRSRSRTRPRRRGRSPSSSSRTSSSSRSPSRSPPRRRRSP